MFAWARDLFADSGHRPGPADDFYYNEVSFPSPAGYAVNERSAMTVPAVYDCLQVRSLPVATLPLMIFRRLPNGGRQPEPNHPIAQLLGRSPSPGVTAYEFRGQMEWDLGLYNNAYAEITAGRRGFVDQLVRLDPRRVTLQQSADGRHRFDYQPVGGARRELAPAQVWHLRGIPLSENGITGRPQLETARHTISACLGLLDYSARFFRNDTQTGGIVEMPGKFKDNKHRKRWQAAWRRAHSGVNRHHDKLLERGMVYKTVAATNEQAQFLQTRVQLFKEIANHWQTPPHKIGIFDGATHSNVHEQGLSFLTETMLPIFERTEQAINTHLILVPQTFFAEFNLTAMLRGDIKTRYEAFARGRQWGWLSVNDIRAFENLNPIDSGDEYLRPMNMVPVDENNPGQRPPRDQASRAEQIQHFMSLYAEQEVVAAEQVWKAAQANGHDPQA